jgi:hypothetical protein
VTYTYAFNAGAGFAESMRRRLRTEQQGGRSHL